MSPLRIGFLSLDHLHVESYLAQVEAHPDAVVAGIWHPDAARGRRVARQHSTPWFSRPEELLEARIDGAIVCSANADHERDTRILADAGIPTLCEKPLAVSTTQARSIVERYRKGRTLLMTAFPCRFSPTAIRARELIASGELGTMLSAATTNRGTAPGGWFADAERSGGGAVMDHTVHVVDLLRWMLESEVVKVYAEGSNRLFGGSVEDTGLVMLEFENGTAASLDTSWSRPARRYPTWGDVTLELVGELGHLGVDLFCQVAEVYSQRHETGMHVSYGDDLDAAMIAAFLTAIRQGLPSPVPGEDGMRAVEVAEAALKSIETGTPVRFRSRRKANRNPGRS
jgi:predicted dehydrogenase